MANEHPIGDRPAPQIKEWLEILPCLPVRTRFRQRNRSLCNPRFRSRREIYKDVEFEHLRPGLFKAIHPAKIVQFGILFEAVGPYTLLR
jgi:hypothetical protein